MCNVARCLNIADLRTVAKRRLPRGLFEFIDRGSEDEVALRNNRESLDRIKLRPRVLVDVSRRQQDITLFGQRQSMPLIIAPTGPAGQVWYRGEIALARAASAAGIPFTLSTAATTPMETVIEEGGGSQWFQLYMWPDEEMSFDLVRRADRAGFGALVLTLDSIVPTNREFNVRNGFTIPLRLNARNTADIVTHPRWLFGVIMRYLLTTGMPRYENYPTEVKAKLTALPLAASMAKNDSLTWDHLKRIRELWPRRLIVKGILDARDAHMAVACGADGIVVSNHGGVVCDSAMAPIDALPSIVEAVGSRTTIIIDSGYRRGSDVVKALALGADAVMIGRATLYGTAAGGQAGATRAIEILRNEIDRMLAILGCAAIGDLRSDHVVVG